MEREPIQITSIELVDFGEENENSKLYLSEESEIERLAELKLNVRALLGIKLATVGEIKRFQVGDILEVDRIDGHNVDIYVGDEKIAIGEIIPMDNNFGLSISQVLDNSGEFLKKVKKNGDVE